MSGCPHEGRYADFRALVTTWASMRMWRVTLACGLHAIDEEDTGPWCEVQRWNGIVGNDGSLLPLRDVSQGITSGWARHTIVPVELTQEDEFQDPTTALHLLCEKYFLNRGLGELLKYIWDMDYKDTDALSFAGRGHPVTWYNFTQGLPDAAVFDVKWATEAVAKPTNTTVTPSLSALSTVAPTSTPSVCRVFTGVGSDSNYIAAEERILFEVQYNE